MFYDVVQSLCDKRNISISQLAIDLKISKSNITNWKNGSRPRADKIEKIASYFDVSTDYLLENRQKNKPAAESDELGPKGRIIWEKLKEIDAIDHETYEFALKQLEVTLKSVEKKDNY